MRNTPEGTTIRNVREVSENDYSKGGMALLELQSDETKKKRENTTTARIRAETTGISLMEFHAPGK